MERAGAAILLPPGHPIHSFINDGMDLCVWLLILQVRAVRSICCGVLLLFLGFSFFSYALHPEPATGVRDCIRKMMIHPL